MIICLPHFIIFSSFHNLITSSHQMCRSFGHCIVKMVFISGCGVKRIVFSSVCRWNSLRRHGRRSEQGKNTASGCKKRNLSLLRSYFRYAETGLSSWDENRTKYVTIGDCSFGHCQCVSQNVERVEPNWFSEESSQMTNDLATISTSPVDALTIRSTSSNVLPVKSTPFHSNIWSPVPSTIRQCYRKQLFNF